MKEKSKEKLENEFVDTLFFTLNTIMLQQKTIIQHFNLRDKFIENCREFYGQNWKGEDRLKH